MYKFCNVVMLSTNEKARGQLTLNKDYPSLNSNLLKIRNSSWFDSFTKNKWINQHLYITSDEFIQKDDWYIHNQNPTGLKTYQNTTNMLPMDAKKIIATTDKALIKNISRPLGVTQELPQIPQQFIEHYVSEYNQGRIITEVMVEFEQVVAHEIDGLQFMDYTPKLKLTNNTINIQPVKDSYSREEVHNLMMQSWINGEAKPNQHYSVRENWIKQNLK